MTATDDVADSGGTGGGVGDSGDGTGGAPDADLDRRTRPQRLLDGLVGACKAALTTGTLPAAGGLRPQVMVTIDYRDLLDRLEHTTNQGPRYRPTDHRTYPGTLRRHSSTPAPPFTRHPRHRLVHLHRPRHRFHRPEDRLRRRHHPRPARQPGPHPGHRPHHPDLPAPHPQSHHRPRPGLRLPRLHHPRTLVRSPPHHLLVTRRTHQHRQRNPALLPSPPPHPQGKLDHPGQNRRPLVHPATPHRPTPKTPAEHILPMLSNARPQGARPANGRSRRWPTPAARSPQPYGSYAFCSRQGLDRVSQR